MINIIIIDDHKLIREGLKQLIEFNEDMSVVAEYSSGIDYLNEIDNNEADIILLDINMPDMNGLDVLDKIKQHNNNQKVIILTVHNEVEYLVKARKYKSEGYILKDAGFEELRNAIIRVNEGGIYIHPSLIPAFNNFMIKKYKDDNLIDTLTAREIEVLKLVVIGGSNKDIADKLGISERTIKNHISNIFKKINVSDRTQAAVFAIKNDLISVK